MEVNTIEYQLLFYADTKYYYFYLLFYGTSA